MKIKICANKNIEDIKCCIESHVDIAGILIGKKHNSQDFISLKKGAEIGAFAKNKIDIAVVTHLEDSQEIIRICKIIGNNFLQLHSNIGDVEVYKIKESLPYVKIIRVINITKDRKIITNLNDIKLADYYLLDSINIVEDKIGGTGLVQDWNFSAEIIKN